MLLSIDQLFLEAPSQFNVFSKVEDVVLKLKSIEYLQVNPDRHSRRSLPHTRDGQRENKWHAL